MASLMAVLTLGGMSKRIRKYRAVARPGFWEAKKNEPLCSSVCRCAMTLQKQRTTNKAV